MIPFPTLVQKAGDILLVQRPREQIAGLFGANVSYATPVVYKTNLLVTNAGKYIFNDFLRVGVPLVLIMWVTLSWLLPILCGIKQLVNN